MILQPQALFIEAGHGKSPGGSTDGGATRTVVLPDGRLQIITERELTIQIARRVLSIMKTKRAELGNGIIQGVGIETAASTIRKMTYVNSVITQNRLDPAKCFGIAIHINSAASPAAGGIEAWFQPERPEGVTLCDFVAKGLNEWIQTGLRSQYIRPSNASRFGRLYIQDAGCTYMLIECGFLTNDADLDVLRFRTERVATGIAHGLMQYFRKRLRRREG